jgi:hypothetical protein
MFVDATTEEGDAPDMTNPSATRRSRRPLSELDGRLPDGSPLYGEIGVLAVDPETGQVQCAACGQ